MSSTFIFARVLVLATAAVLAAAPALADKDHKDKHGKGPKHGKHQQHDVKQGAFFSDHDRESARGYYVQTYPQGRKCPPGLAKKNNGCLPPGQAKKWAMGQPLARNVVWYPVPQPVLVRLQPVPAGYRYVRVGNDILLLSPQSAVVVDVISGLLG